LRLLNLIKYDLGFGEVQSGFISIHEAAIISGQQSPRLPLIFLESLLGSLNILLAFEARGELWDFQLRWLRRYSLQVIFNALHRCHAIKVASHRHTLIEHHVCGLLQHIVPLNILEHLLVLPEPKGPLVKLYHALERHQQCLPRVQYLDKVLRRG
jgi:hypothetical protein